MNNFKLSDLLRHNWSVAIKNSSASGNRISGLRTQFHIKIAEFHMNMSSRQLNRKHDRISLNQLKSITAHRRKYGY
jgi:hypothetical protein